MDVSARSGEPVVLPRCWAPLHVSQRYRLGCDVGGTFTDFALVGIDSGAITLEKCLTTPDDLTRAILEGIERLTARVPGAAGAMQTLIHGTTLIINTLLERTGARTALLATEGLRDVLETRLEQRYDKYDIFQDFPEPLVPRYLRREVPGRIHASGRELSPLDPDAVRTTAAELTAQGVESIAVCLLHSYANPAHERVVGEILAECAPDLMVSLSSDVLPEIGEYERASTTVTNAYVRPRVARYLDELAARVKANGFDGELFLLSSDGGLISPATSSRMPVRIIESGPAGGVIATEQIGRVLDRPNLLSFDMGGTTAKVCAVTDGRALVTKDYEVERMERFKRGSGIPVQAPTLDLLEVGTGGGSIAWLDRLGLLRVGPKSSGADPGPACYGRGGVEPTVTDADLILGYLASGSFLGGRMALDVGAARSALAERIGEPLGLSAIESAAGVHDVASEAMAVAARAYLRERGLDPEELPLVAFGGAGPMHAFAVARKLRSPLLIIPPSPGAFSAVGFLVAEPAIRVSRTHKVPVAAEEWNGVREAYRTLVSEGRALLPRNAVGDVTIRLSANMRYLGQGYSIFVTFPSADPSALTTEEVEQAFVDAYRALYTRTYPDGQVEILNLDVRVACRAPALDIAARSSTAGGDPRIGTRPAYFTESGRHLATPVLDRYRLAPGFEGDGPLIVEEVESTTIVGPGGRLRVDPSGAFLIHVPHTEQA